MLDRTTTDIAGVYGDVWQAYNRLAARAIADLLDETEVSSAIADRFDSPSRHDVEGPIIATVNDRKRRLALATMQQVSSEQVDGLQAVDLLLGSITYQVRETHSPTHAEGPRMEISREVMQEHYGLTSYLQRGPGQLEMNRLRITLLPLPKRSRGRRGGTRSH